MADNLKSYLASSYTINDGTVINILAISDGSLKSQYNRPDGEIGETKAVFKVPEDIIVSDLIKRFAVDDGVEERGYWVEDIQNFKTPNLITQKYTISGVLIDKYTKLPISNANLLFPLPTKVYKVKTDTKGAYKLETEIPVNKNTLIPAVRPSILVTAEGYIPNKLKPYALDQTIREDLPLKELTSVEGLIDEAKLKFGRLKDDVRKKIRDLKKNFNWNGIKKLVKKFIRRNRKRIIPFLLALAAKFFVGKIQDILSGQISAREAAGPCPSKEELKRLVEQRNKIVRELNNIYKVLDIALRVAGIVGGLSVILQIAVGILKNIPLPTSVPPGVGIPVNVILKFQEKITQIEGTIETLGKISIGILSALLVFTALLAQVLDILKLLDYGFNRCAEGKITLEELSEELKNINSESGPTVTEVNGFIMGVQVDEKTLVGSLKRRYAVAKNKDGVVLLKGESSFSSSDQILIDELVFYIQTNNLKAN